MNETQAVQLVASVNEEDLFEHGQVFSKMDPEPIFWKVLEVAETDAGRRVTFHLYFRDVYLKSLVGLITPDNKVEWKG